MSVQPQDWISVAAALGSLCCALFALLVGAGVIYFLLRNRGGPLDSGSAVASPPRRSPTDMRAAVRSAFDRTGYRHLSVGDAPLEQHVEESMRTSPDGHTHVHMVRPLAGGTLHFEQHTGDGFAATEYRCGWWVPLSAPPRVSLQIIERSQVGAAAIAREIATSQHRIAPEPLPFAVLTGDPNVDGRFRITSDDAAAAAVVLADPGLRGALVSLTQVDLQIGPDRARFDDPMQDNARAAMGGVAGMRAAAANPAALFERQFMLHDRVADLLSGLIAATGSSPTP